MTGEAIRKMQNIADVVARLDFTLGEDVCENLKTLTYFVFQRNLEPDESYKEEDEYEQFLAVTLMDDTKYYHRFTGTSEIPAIQLILGLINNDVRKAPWDTEADFIAWESRYRELCYMTKTPHPRWTCIINSTL